MSLTTHHIISHSTRVSNPRTCTGAELFPIWMHLRDFLCTFISNGLTSPKWSPAWPTPRLKLSQGYRFTMSLYFLSGWRWAFVPTQDTCNARHFWWFSSFQFYYNHVQSFFPSLSSVMVSYRGSPSYICLWKISTSLFAQVYHEVWRHGENL